MSESIIIEIDLIIDHDGPRIERDGEVVTRDFQEVKQILEILWPNLTIYERLRSTRKETNAKS